MKNSIFATLTCFTARTGKIKASWRTWPRQWPAVVWSSLQCSWTKSTKESVQNSSTAMRKIHCHLSLNYSCVCQRWHNQQVGLLVLNDSLSSTNHFFLKKHFYVLWHWLFSMFHHQGLIKSVSSSCHLNKLLTLSHNVLPSSSCAK